VDRTPSHNPFKKPPNASSSCGGSQKHSVENELLNRTAVLLINYSKFVFIISFFLYFSPMSNKFGKAIQIAKKIAVKQSHSSQSVREAFTVKTDSKGVVVIKLKK